MAKGFKHGTSGSTLNFKVVGNPQPAKPKENTIWIDTDQKITGWAFSATQPTGSTGVMKKVSGQTITVADGSDAPMQGLKIFGKTTQNGTPTPDAPVPLESVGDGGSVGVTVAGKNILPLPYFDGKYKTHFDVTYTVGTDGGIQCAGTPTGISSFSLYRGKPIIDKFTVSLSGTTTNIEARVMLRTDELVTTNIIEHRLDTGKSIAVDLSEYPDCKFIVIGLWRKTNGVECSGVAYVQMESGDNATEYAVPLAQQLLTVQKPADVPVFLPGIPVSSGGNYTDENGQQWICDEVDFASGKYVQRITKKQYNGTENLSYNSRNKNVAAIITNAEKTDRIYDHIFCTHLKTRTAASVAESGGIACRTGNAGILIGIKTEINLDAYTQAEVVAIVRDLLVSEYESGNPVTVVYALATPIEHDLSAEELAQYAALHTNFHSTTIYNDAGAYMEVKYEKCTDLDGAVWITTGSFSTVAFNALKKNGIQVYPIYAKQYVSGAWVDKTAKSYQNGEWVDWWNGELFDNGNQFEAATGGWTSDGITFATMPVVGATITSNKITFPTNASSVTCIQTKNKINCAAYSRLYVEFINFSGTNNRAVEFGLFSDRDMANNGVAVQTPALTPTGEKRTEYLDISEYDGSYYVGCTAGNARSSEVYRVWME